ncbi:MAG: glycosyltransferase 61 family protein [Sandaracinaceae bacterium]
MGRLTPILQRRVVETVAAIAAGEARGTALLRQLVANNDNRKLICMELADRLEAAGCADLALAMWRAACDFDPRDPEVALSRARLAAALGHDDEATASRARAEGARLAAPALVEAKAAYEASRYDDAVAALQAALAAAPFDGRAWMDLADNLREAGRHREALDAIAAMRARFPQAPMAVDAVERMGRTLMAMGRLAEAGEALSEWHSSMVHAYGAAASRLHGRQPVMLHVRRVEEVAERVVSIAPSVPVVVESPNYHPPFRIDGPTDERAPPLFVAHVRDAQVLGESGVVARGDDLVVYDEAASPSLRQDNIPEYSGWVDPEGRALTFAPSAITARLDAAVLIGGRAASNYFHWMLEHLPKVLFLDPEGGDAALPHLVNERMPRQCREAFELLAPGREVVALTKESRVAVGRLVLPSLGGIMHDDARVPLSKRMIAPETVRRLREAVLERVDTSAPSPKRVMLTRPNSVRRGCVNEAALAALLEARGFALIDPVALSFSEQVALVHNAETIVVTVGAGMTNAVFMREGARMIGLWGESVPPHYFAGLAPIVGAEMIFARGTPIPGSHPDPLHRDFVVPEAHLLDLIESEEPSWPNEERRASS